MLRKFLSALVIIALLSCTALAGGDIGDWANVRKQKPGTRIVVLTRAGRELKGEVRIVTDDKLFVEVRLPNGDLQDMALDRSEVVEVKRRGGSAGGLNPLLGALGGLGVGLAAGAVYDESHKYSDDPGMGKLLFGLVGISGGLAVGSRLRAKDKTIYVAP